MRQALYRKYRSKSLDEIIGQEHITETLKHAIEKQRISHAYLFTGPRGVGKTSIARILAHQLNDVPYSGEDSHLDIIEIDAASTGGVDEIRELREKVYIAPANGKYKVYIIDEVHMMSTAAFNALLKTLEEPPAHVIFILATTEAHKLPATIISRTQRYSFRPIAPEKIVNHLRFIANQEKIDITDEALELIAVHSEGSFRDSIGMLDQVSSLHNVIGREELEQLLGIPAESVIQEIITDLQNHDVNKLIQLLASLRSSGFQAAVIAKLLSQKLKTIFINNQSAFDKQQLLNLLTKLIEVPVSHNPEQLLELILLDVALSENTLSNEILPQENSNHHQLVDIDLPVKEKNTLPQKDQVVSKKDKLNKQSKLEPIEDRIIIDDRQWQTALGTLKTQSNTLYGIIKLGQPSFLPGKIILTFNHLFHQKQANITKNKLLLSTITSKIVDQEIEIECLYRKDDASPTETPDQTEDIPNNISSIISPLETINNIFGGGELLES